LAALGVAWMAHYSVERRVVHWAGRWVVHLAWTLVGGWAEKKAVHWAAHLVLTRVAYLDVHLEQHWDNPSVPYWAGRWAAHLVLKRVAYSVASKVVCWAASSAEHWENLLAVC